MSFEKSIQDSFHARKEHILNNFEPNNDLEKGIKGEGSKGGKVIGHTKSGKPIYQHKTSRSYIDFSSQDHKDAKDLHHQERIKMSEEMTGRKKDPNNIYWMASISEMREKNIPQETIDQYFKHGDISNGHDTAFKRLKKTESNSKLEKGETSIEEQIYNLREEEQNELHDAIENVGEYIGEDGKVDRDLLINEEDIDVFDEIYNKYDKLITPLLNASQTSSEETNFDSIVSTLFNLQIKLEHCHRKTKNEPKHEALGEAYNDVADIKDSIIEHLTGLLETQYETIDLMPITSYSPEMCELVADEIGVVAKQIQSFAMEFDFLSVDNLAQELAGIGAKLKYKLLLNEDANEDNQIISEDELVKGLVSDLNKGIIEDEEYISSMDLIKGGKKAFLGEIRKFGGRDYVKTADGWKFHGKGTGEKAKSHVAGTKSNEPSPNDKMKEEMQSQRDREEKSHLNKEKKDVKSMSLEDLMKEHSTLESMKTFSMGTKTRLRDLNQEIESRHKKEEVNGIKINDSVQLVSGLGLISLADLKGQKLTVTGIVKTGLISQPYFVKVKDEKGEEHELNPDYLKKSEKEDVHPMDRGKKIQQPPKEKEEVKSEGKDELKSQLDAAIESAREGMKGNTDSMRRNLFRDLQTLSSDFNSKATVGKIARNLGTKGYYYHPSAVSLAKKRYEELTSKK